MLSFLLEEGIITVGAISGLFTASMLNSFRSNILEPSMEKLIPSHKLDKSQFDDEDSSLENIMTLQTNTKENKKTGRLNRKKRRCREIRVRVQQQQRPNNKTRSH